MAHHAFLEGISRVIDRIGSTQADALDTAAGWIADAIGADHHAFLFGAGHSFLAVMDTYPRIGSYPGWVPIHELSTSYMPDVLGNQGLRQVLFLERVEGFGRLVMENYRLGAEDVMVVISNSGVNPMGIDVALVAKEHGARTIAVTSRAHSERGTSRHSSGQRLLEVSDLVIDTCVPAGDALVEVPGFPHPVASASTIAACVVMQALVAETAARLAARGHQTPVFPSHNTGMSAEQHEAAERMVDAWFAEHARRTAGLLR
jgi:uncharacterized phosphosugar-binding protein